MFWLIGTIILLVIAFICTYEKGKNHELTKIHDFIVYKKKDIKTLVAERKDNNDFNNDYYQGELEELDEVEEIINNELEQIKLS